MKVEPMTMFCTTTPNKKVIFRKIEKYDGWLFIEREIVFITPEDPDWRKTLRLWSFHKSMGSWYRHTDIEKMCICPEWDKWQQLRRRNEEQWKN